MYDLIKLPADLSIGRYIVKVTIVDRTANRIAEKTVPVMQSGIPLKDLGLFKRTAERVEVPTPISSRLYDLLNGTGSRT